MSAQAQEKPVIELPMAYSRREDREPPVVQNASPMQMLAVAVQRGMDAATIKDLMDLNDRWQRSEAERAYNEAFAAFKAEAVQIIRAKTVDAGPLAGKRYAELYSVVDAVTPALSLHGLSASWKITKDEPQWIEVTCYLKHVKGHSESVTMGGPPDAGGAKNGIQARASTVSYLQRYTLKAICGVAEKNDDTNGGKGSPEPDPEGKAKLEACGSLASLQEAWKALTPAQRKTLAEIKNECKARIEEADREAAKE